MDMKTDQFVHLHVHSLYSKFDGTCYIPGLFEECRRLCMPGFALTDHGTIAGVDELFEVARDYPDVKPIAGCEIYLTDHFDHRIKDENHLRCFHLILLAKNLTGYQNLKAIVNRSWKEGFYRGRPRISHEVVAAHRGGLICTNACIGGEVAQAILSGDMVAAKDAVRWYRDVFGEDFYLEIDLQPNTVENRIYPKQRLVAEKMSLLSKEMGVKMIAANDVHFLSKEEAPFHDLMLCEKTHSDPNNPDRFRYTGQEWFKSTEEMALAFRQYNDAMKNTIEILNKIERF